MTDVTHDQPTAEPSEDTFDLDAWIRGATPTEHTVPVYGKRHLLAELDEVERRIRDLTAVLDRQGRARRAITDTDELAEAHERWKQIAKEIEASKIVVRVRGLSSKRTDELRTEYRKANGIPRKQAHTTDLEGQSDACLLEAIQFPRFHDLDSLRRFKEAVGSAQWSQIVRTFDQACLSPVQVTPPFSPGSSDDPDGEEY